MFVCTIRTTTMPYLPRDCILVCSLGSLRSTIWVSGVLEFYGVDMSEQARERANWTNLACLLSLCRPEGYPGGWVGSLSAIVLLRFRFGSADSFTHSLSALTWDWIRHTHHRPGWRSFGLGDGLYFGYVGNDDDDDT